MSTPRSTARTVGILFLVSYIGVAIGAALMAPALDPDTSLDALHSDKTRIILGALAEFVNDAAVVGIAALLYPFLKRAGEGLALWYVGIRIFEGGLFMIASASVLSLLDVSDRFVEADGGASYEDARAAAFGQNYGADLMATVAFIVGAILLYTLLFRSRLVPRFIAVWGFFAVGGIIAVNLLAPDISEASVPILLLVLPMITNELFLAVWLIVKGFSPVPATEAAAR